MSDLSTALDQTRAFLTRYVAFARPEQADAVALWIGHTWVYDQFDTTPYLAVQSPERRSGKTRLLECLRLLVREPLPVAGTSMAALFRVINERHPTLLLDEADTVFNRKADGGEDLRGLLNNGYRRGTPYLRVVGESTKMHVEAFDVFCPKAVASIGRLPDTVQDRSVVIQLSRRARSEGIAAFRFRTAEREALPIRESWEMLSDTMPEEASVPGALNDRAADNWEPLCAISDAAGDDWSSTARRAALVLSGEQVEDERAGILLLADIRTVFAVSGAQRVSMRALLEELHSDAYAEHPWQEWGHGRGLKATGVGRLLAPFNVYARQMWIDGANRRGYELEQLADVFDRYLPRPETPSQTVVPLGMSVTAEHEPSGTAVKKPPTGGETAAANGPVDGGEPSSSTVNLAPLNDAVFRSGFAQAVRARQLAARQEDQDR